MQTCIALLLAACSAHAETGTSAWLRYAPPPDPPRYHDMPHAVVRLGSAPEELAAADELDRGLGHMIAGSDVLLERFHPNVDAIILGTTEALHRARLTRQIKTFHEKPLPPEGFRIQHLHNGARHWWIIQGGSPRAELYGAFRFMSLVAQDRQLPEELIDSPAGTIRWVEQDDNLDGTVDRGYAGPSIFFEDGHIRSDLHRVGDYARLLGSVGINGLAVRTDPRLLTPALLPGLVRIADQLRPWGIRLALSVDLSSLKTIGNLPTVDPLNPQNIAWWQSKVDELYRVIPDFAGFNLAVDSEAIGNQTEPIRSPVDVTNALARPLAKHGGLVLLRTSTPVGSSPKIDPALTAFGTFHPLDGKFLPNVVLQIDSLTGFELREPIPPLIAALRHTPQTIHLQITEEYTGQQRHMVYLAPLWKSLLDTDLRVDSQQTLARDIITGNAFHQSQGGFLGTANVGMDANWLHHPMAMANLYSFGRLAWDPTLDPASILDEWTRMTWSNDARVYKPIEQMNLASAHVYEQYTTPPGFAPFNDPVTHFGPSPETHDLVDKNKTIIQNIYNTHYAGASAAQNFLDQWETLKPLIDEDRYTQVHDLLAFQAHHAEVWRDAVNLWFARQSNIPDVLGYVGHHPGRIEAEAMQSTGFHTVDVPSITASAGKAVLCEATQCTLQTTFHGEPNPYRVEIGYFDLHPGEATYRLLVNNTEIAHWTANDNLPPDRPDPRLNGNTATRFTAEGIRLHPGDTITLQATPNGNDPAAVDFLEITRDPRWN